MDLPRTKSVDSQLRLFDNCRVIRSKGEARWAVGDVCEDLVAKISGGKRLVTDCSKSYCPDICYDSDVFFESKAVGRSGQMILYDNRILKDLAFVKDHNCQLFYWVANHSSSVLDFCSRSIDDLKRSVCAGLKSISVVPVDMINSLVCGVDSRVVNSGYTKSGNRLGYGSNGYGRGWTVSYKSIRSLCRFTKYVMIDDNPVPVYMFDDYRFLRSQQRERALFRG